jgi:hypothetical protein
MVQGFTPFPLLSSWFVKASWHRFPGCLSLLSRLGRYRGGVSGLILSLPDPEFGTQPRQAVALSLNPD